MKFNFEDKKMMAPPSPTGGPTGIVSRNDIVKEKQVAEPADTTTEAVSGPVAVPDTLESVIAGFKADREKGIWQYERVANCQRLAKFCATLDPSSMSLEEALRVGDLIYQVSHVGGRGGRMASAISTGSNIGEQKKRFDTVIDAFWDKAIKEGRATLGLGIPKETPRVLWIEKRDEMREQGYQFVTNEKGEFISIKPDSPEAQALVKVYGKEVEAN